MVKIYASSVIGASTTGLWGRMRDFGNLSWHPWIVECYIHHGQPGDRVGCIRDAFRHDGIVIRQQLMALSDQHCYSSWSLLEISRPGPKHTSTLKLTPVTDSNSTFIEWSAEFDVSLDLDLVQDFENAFRSGLDRLKLDVDRLKLANG
jgi:hypothetical protein